MENRRNAYRFSTSPQSERAWFERTDQSEYEVRLVNESASGFLIEFDGPIPIGLGDTGQLETHSGRFRVEASRLELSTSRVGLESAGEILDEAGCEEDAHRVSSSSAGVASAAWRTGLAFVGVTVVAISGFLALLRYIADSDLAAKPDSADLASLVPEAPLKTKPSTSKLPTTPVANAGLPLQSSESESQGNLPSEITPSLSSAAGNSGSRSATPAARSGSSNSPAPINRFLQRKLADLATIRKMAAAGQIELTPSQLTLLEAVEARATASNTLTAIQDSHRSMFETLSDGQKRQFRAFVSRAAKP